MMKRLQGGIMAAVGLALLGAGCAHREPCGAYLPSELQSRASKPFNGQAEGQAGGLEYYRCRAQRDDEEAMYRLGLAYEQGIGVDVDMDKAADWYEKAGRAKTGLDYNYLYDRPVQEGPVTQGHAEAQYRLGLMYLHGRGRKQDDGFARLWFGRAVTQGHEGARKEIENLDRGLRKEKD